MATWVATRNNPPRGGLHRPDRPCRGRPGAVRSSQISYEQLLEIFWQIHDPTTLNRQGPDVGTQYRSAVFYHDEASERPRPRSKERLQASGRFRRPIVTEITPAGTFWPAEEYHQKYIQKHGGSSCHL